MKKQIIMPLLLAWGLFLCLAGPTQAVRFRFEDLGSLGGGQYQNSGQCGINDAGQVVGRSYAPDGNRYAFLKSPGQPMQPLPLFPGTSEAHATCINNSGVIGGWYYNGFIRGCKWVLEPGQGYRIIDPASQFQGIEYSIQHLNEAGFLVGQGPNPSYPAHHAMVIIPGGEYRDLCTNFPISAARGINDANTIIGSYSYWTEFGTLRSVACIWTYAGGTFSGPTSLIGLSGSSAAAINNQGQAVGTFYVPNPGFSDVPHGFLKSPGQDYQDLGPNTEAYDINDSGWIVGKIVGEDVWTACIWTPQGGLENLNSKVVNLPSGVTLVSALAINQRGEIAGDMLISDFQGGVYKLTPVAPAVEPSSSLLLLD